QPRGLDPAAAGDHLFGHTDRVERLERRRMYAYRPAARGAVALIEHDHVTACPREQTADVEADRARSDHRELRHFSSTTRLRNGNIDRTAQRWGTSCLSSRGVNARRIKVRPSSTINDGPDRSEAPESMFTYIEKVAPGDVRDTLEAQGKEAGLLARKPRRAHVGPLRA